MHFNAASTEEDPSLGPSSPKSPEITIKTVLDIRMLPPCRLLTAAEFVLMNTLTKSNTWGERKLGVRWRMREAEGGGCYMFSYLRYEHGESSNGRREAKGGIKKVMKRQELWDGMGFVRRSFLFSVPPQSI